MRAYFWIDHFYSENYCNIVLMNIKMREAFSVFMYREKQTTMATMGLYHKTVEWLLGYKRRKQAEEEFENESWRSVQGRGDTNSEIPITLEQNHEGEDLEWMENVILERQIDVKGDSLIPDKFPARVIFVPTIFLKLTPVTTGSARES